MDINTLDSTSHDEAPRHIDYAGFWLRFVAILIDGIVIWVVMSFIITPILSLLGAGYLESLQNINPSDYSEDQMFDLVTTIWGGMIYSILISQGIYILYFALMESSNNQGTLGKMALGIIVTDESGEKLNFGKALVRNLCKILSSLIMYIGYIIAAFTDKKQALHDIIANTLVVKK
ncbi:RDD family protein [Fulvivirga sediminis]|uniref:RDD family protein n=1 Tax=Fulvivirga sediminis TaxID=2803949 RepID=A0A937F9U1_9BACT|nr:RDD family protein [Fulvivirga sediminis]MBL3657871.1 RDD family protein [Fulvivirga sediminis]